MIDFDVQKPVHLLNQVDLEGLYNILTVCAKTESFGEVIWRALQVSHKIQCRNIYQ